MSNLAEKYPWTTSARYLGEARIVELDETNGRALVQLDASAGNVKVWAAIATSYRHELTPGAVVLAAGEESQEYYIIGVLKPAQDSPKIITLSKGTSAEASGQSGQQTMRVFSAKNELLFEYDEKTGTARVNMPSGDIEFITHKGSISFSSAQDIRFSGHKMDLDGDEISMTAHKGNLRVDEAVYSGEKVTATITNARLMAERLETAAQTMIEKAKNLFQSVEELSQLKAGRMRTLVQKTFHFKADKAFVKAEQDYKIRAKKIHLG